MGIDITNLPPAAQIIAYLVIGVAGAVAWVMAARKQSSPDDDGARLAAERQDLRDQIAAALLRDSANQLREDVAKVLEANREAFFKSLHDQDRRQSQELGELEDRVRTLEIEHAGMKERLGLRGSRR